jgi:transposase
MGKLKLVALILEKKKEVWNHLSKGESCRKQAEDFGISKSTVSNISSNRAAITEAWEKNCSAERKRIRKTPHDELNDKVLEFFSVVMERTFLLVVHFYRRILCE